MADCRIPITAVVLAGGFGTRIAGLHPDVPKPMIAVAGMPFLHWVTQWIISQGIADIVYSVGHHAQAVERWTAALSDGGGVRRRTKRELTPLGTGGGALNCLDMCSDYVLIANGDTLLLADCGPSIARLATEPLDGVIFAVSVEDASRFGSITVCDGLLRSFSEKRSGHGLVYGGVMILRRSVLLSGFPPKSPLSLETEILPDLIATGKRIAVTVTDAPFLDIGTPDSLAQGDEFVRLHRDQLSKLDQT
jgi:D-glycero-alpha-D-manno-heptose 1-phosphate guanylyltransferase